MDRDSLAAVLDAENVLQPAYSALGDADPQRARAIVLAALAEAEGNHDRHRQAKALLLLGHLDRLASRFRKAHDSANLAAQLFRTLGDAIGESGALSTLAHASSCLGRNEEAVESALISVRLAEPMANASHNAMLFNYLGVAYLWCRDFPKANAALETAIALAEGSNGTVSAFQPLINQLLAEAISAVSARYQTGRLPSLERMVALHRRCDALVKTGSAAGLFSGGRSMGIATWLLSSALVRAWTGELDAAGTLIGRAQPFMAAFEATTLAHAFGHWVGAEFAWARQDLRQAASHCTGLVEMAQQLEYEQMACLGYVLLSQIYESLNEHPKAFDALRRLRHREELIRAESLESRERAVQWHLDLRLVEKSVRQLEGVSKHLERLSLEDSLTGLANRRCLEQKLQSVLALRSVNGAPMSIAFIDVDRFKRVNDQHSHHVGDLVLKAIAAILLLAIRDHDTAARLSGDEFAILFQRADASEALNVCERISSAVLGFAWGDIAAGLAVTVSIGTATAHDDDSAESLLHRGDAAMYAAKRRATSVAGAG